MTETAGGTPTYDEVVERIRKTLAEMEIAEADEARLDATWDDLDVDSLDLVEMVRALEDAYGLEIPDSELENVETVADAANLVVRLTEEKGAA
ncbi:acyl carrier protein [Thermoleophilia bacterium SCSIO 60948]|nr:acyl carrier protein [Thermoleophilia bacterium SCSIO 60948]